MKRMPHLLLPQGAVHEDFRTLKEEVQRETWEVEKLSPEGKSPLLSSPQQTPREEKGATRPRVDGEDPSGKGRRCRGTGGGGSQGGAHGPGRWLVAREESAVGAFSKGLVMPPLRLPGLPLLPAPLWRWAKQCRFPGWAAGQQKPSF